jgi:hypothetical protein
MAQTTELRIGTLNCEGFRRSEFFIHIILSEFDCLCLQETWLLRDNIARMNSLDSNYLAYAKSGVDEEAEILQGRPYGGVGILFHKRLAPFIQPLPIDSARACGIILKCNMSVKIVLISVYMPCDNYSMHNANVLYEDVLDAIESVLSSVDYDHCILCGDFNTSFSRSNAQTRCLNAFIDRCLFKVCWNSTYAVLSDTYCNNAMNHFSCIDHFMVNSVLFDHIANCEVIQCPLNPSNHNVVSMTCEIPVPDAKLHTQSATTQDIPRQDHRLSLDWGAATPGHTNSYKTRLDGLLAPISEWAETVVVDCGNPECKDPDHVAQVDKLCCDMIDICVTAAEETIPMRRRGRRPMPGWNKEARPEREVSIFWHRIWLECGSPKAGWVYNIMKSTRSKYHYAVRALRKREDEMRRSRRSLTIEKTFGVKSNTSDLSKGLPLPLWTVYMKKLTSQISLLKNLKPCTAAHQLSLGSYKDCKELWTPWLRPQPLGQ